MKKQQSETHKSISIRFPLDLLQEIRDLAKEGERSFNGQVIWMLREFIKQQGK